MIFYCLAVIFVTSLFDAYHILILINILSFIQSEFLFSMHRVIVYDSVYGNTQKIAEVIASELGAELLPVANANPEKLYNIGLLVVGSPVHGGRATPAVQHFLNQIPPKSLRGIKVTSFDTRVSTKGHGFGLWLLLTIIRYAAERISRSLIKKGGKLIVEPEGFVVEGKEGPLHPGEIERANQWAKSIKELLE